MRQVSRHEVERSFQFSILDKNPGLERARETHPWHGAGLHTCTAFLSFSAPER